MHGCHHENQAFKKDKGKKNIWFFGFSFQLNREHSLDTDYSDHELPDRAFKRKNNLFYRDFFTFAAVLSGFQWNLGHHCLSGTAQKEIILVDY